MTVREVQKMLDKMVARSSTKNQKNPKVRSVKYMTQDLFTIAVVNSKYIGVTRFNPKDETFNPKTGKAVASHRALGEFLAAHANTKKSNRRAAKSRR